ncbi:hypothetical protein VB773_22620 [Haloarculaceae archaeon H-GB2-1]|nr:hypothetical protein [Haloarculaceae archaeon H-GB1-1]MEA5410095.1 hypothetical protein [Haloarculaceae archaeon H-GB2-1]
MSNDEPQGDDVRQTDDPGLLRSVVEELGGYPAHVPQTEGQGDQGLLRIGFRDEDEDLKEITWREFSEEFAEKDLVGFYREDGADVAGDRPVILRKADDVE